MWMSRTKSTPTPHTVKYFEIGNGLFFFFAGHSSSTFQPGFLLCILSFVPSGHLLFFVWTLKPLLLSFGHEAFARWTSLSVFLFSYFSSGLLMLAFLLYVLISIFISIVPVHFSSCFYLLLFLWSWKGGEKSRPPSTFNPLTPVLPIVITVIEPEARLVLRQTREWKALASDNISRETITTHWWSWYWRKKK